MSTANKLTYLNTTKTMLRDSLNKFGSNILTTDTFRSYDTKLNDIYDKLPKVTQSGAGFTLENVQNGQVDDFKMIGTDLYQNQLPSEYTAVEYLQSDNECFIDTGINADYKLSLKMKVACLDSVLEYMGAIKNIDNTNYIRHHLAFAPTAGNIIGIYYGQTNDQLILKEFDNNFHEFNLDIYNKNVSIDNNSTISISYNNFDVGINYYLFARNGSNIAISKGSYKIAYCKMYYEDNLVRDFAPCYRNSDNVAGLYDFVTNTFFTNQGTGTFTVGNNITLPNPDYPQEIKVVEGRQTIADKGKNKFYLNNNYSANYDEASIEVNNNNSFILRMNKTSSNKQSPCANIEFNSNYLKPNTTYTISKKNSNTGYSLNHVGSIRLYINGKYSDFVDTDEYTFTTPGQITSFKILLYLFFDNTTVGNYEIEFYDIQLEEGSTATNSEPYHDPVDYNIDLSLENIQLAKIPNTDYKNRIYKSNGNWYFEENAKKVVLDGSEIITIQNIGTDNWYYQLSVNCYKTDQLKQICSHYNNSGIYNSNTYQGIMMLTEGNFVRIRYGEEDTVANFKAWLSNNNVTLWYPLVNPVTTQITNATLINQLEAISVHTGTNIFTISNDNNIIPEIEITRLKELEKLA